MKPTQPNQITRTARLWGPTIPFPRIPTLAFALLAGSCVLSGLLRAADLPPPGTNAIPDTGRVLNTKTLDDQYRLSMGDRVGYRVIEDKEEAISLVVTDSGELEVPYLFLVLDDAIADVVAHGKTVLVVERFRVEDAPGVGNRVGAGRREVGCPQQSAQHARTGQESECQSWNARKRYRWPPWSGRSSDVVWLR